MYIAGPAETGVAVAKTLNVMGSARQGFKAVPQRASYSKVPV